MLVNGCRYFLLVGLFAVSACGDDASPPAPSRVGTARPQLPTTGDLPASALGSPTADGPGVPVDFAPATSNGVARVAR